MGRRKAVLFSLYATAISTIFCAVIGDYYTLLLSRILIGAFCGFNLTVHVVLIVVRVSSVQVFETIFLCQCLISTFGGVWIPILAYFVMEVVGWRIFVLMTSLPVFVPPILILQFFMSDIPEAPATNSSEETKSEQVIEVPDFRTRLCKVSLFLVLLSYQGFGTILLLPALIQLFNITVVGESGVTDCEAVTKGKEFLLLALVNGAVNFGRFTRYFVKDRVKFRIVFIVMTTITAASYAAVVAKQDSLTIIIVSCFVVKLTYGIMRMEVSFMVYNVKYFGTRMISLGSAISVAMGMMGGAAGTAVASFAAPQIAVLSALVVSVLAIFLAMFLYEQDHM